MCQALAYKGFPEYIAKKIKNKVNLSLKHCSVFPLSGGRWIHFDVCPLD